METDQSEEYLGKKKILWCPLLTYLQFFDTLCILCDHSESEQHYFLLATLHLVAVVFAVPQNFLHMSFPFFFRLFLFFFSCLSDFTAGNAAANYLLYFVPRNILFIQSFAMLVVAWHPSCLYPSLPSRALPACLGKPSVCCRDLGSAAKPMGGKPRPIFYSFIAV